MGGGEALFRETRKAQAGRAAEGSGVALRLSQPCVGVASCEQGLKNCAYNVELLELTLASYP